MMTKTTFICYPLAILTALLVLIHACKKETTASVSATVTALNCSSTTFSGTPVVATAFTGTATVPYTGGTGVSYSAGSAISSTGVSGLTATLQAGTPEFGNYSLAATILPLTKLTAMVWLPAIHQVLEGLSLKPRQPPELLMHLWHRNNQ